MSRIGKKPVPIPSGIKVGVDGPKVTAESSKAKLELPLPKGISVKVDKDGKVLSVERSSDTDEQRALHGLVRSLVNNMMVGLDKGFEKILTIVGTGYNGKIEGSNLVLNVGFCKPVRREIPKGLEVKMNGQTEVIIRGPDKQVVGEFAAQVRSIRKPEPYKGKGIRYKNEVVRKKAGKAFAGAA